MRTSQKECVPFRDMAVEKAWIRHARGRRDYPVQYRQDAQPLLEAAMRAFYLGNYETTEWCMAQVDFLEMNSGFSEVDFLFE